MKFISSRTIVRRSLPRRPTLLRAWVWLLCGWPAYAAAAQTTPPVSTPGPDPRIAEWTEQLAAPRYQDRIEATRRLCQVGPAAREALRAACKHPSFEIAVRAQQIVAVLDRQFFSGVQVRLQPSRTAVAWDEPFDVVLEMSNVSPYEARIPFERQAAAADAAPTDVEQAALIVDAADCLDVTDGASQPVTMRIDDINEDAAISAMINARASAGPVSVLAPGETIRVTLPQFNRGWARFPLLVEGSATIRFVYVPEWPDDETFGDFNRQQIGAVTSDPIKVRVTRGAPSALSRSGRLAELTVERLGDEFVARLLCLYDRPIQVNTQYGPTLPFAQFQWVLHVGDEDRFIPGAAPAGSRLTDFKAAKFMSIEPGQSLELGRVKVARVREVCAAPPNPSSEPCRLTASYANLCSRAWQIDQHRRDAEEWKTMPEELTRPLPLRIVAGQLRTEPVAIDGR